MKELGSVSDVSWPLELETFALCDKNVRPEGPCCENHSTSSSEDVFSRADRYPVESIWSGKNWFCNMILWPMHWYCAVIWKARAGPPFGGPRVKDHPCFRAIFVRLQWLVVWTLDSWSRCQSEKKDSLGFLPIIQRLRSWIGELLPRFAGWWGYAESMWMRL